MEQLIELLRNARKEKNLSLRDISAQTKVPLHLLEAIEKHDFSRFAGEVYIKGVISSYAKMVGYEPKEIINMYNRIREQENEEEQLIENSEEKKDQKKTVIKKTKIKKQESISFSSTGIYTFLFLLLISGIWLFYSGDDEDINDKNDNIVQQGQDGEKDSEARKDEGESEVEEDPVVIEVVLVESNYSESRFELSGTDDIEMKMVFDGNCWIDLNADNSNVHTETFNQGKEINLTAEEHIKVLLGNPPVVNIFINDVEIEGLDDKTAPHNYIFNMAK